MRRYFFYCECDRCVEEEQAEQQEEGKWEEGAGAAPISADDGEPYAVPRVAVVPQPVPAAAGRPHAAVLLLMTLFMNKYFLSTVHGAPETLAMMQMCTTAAMGAARVVPATR
eukprot:gene52431-5023_t